MELKKLRESIAIFYDLNRKHGKKYTYHHFEKCGLAKSSIYDIMARFDKRGTVDHKSGAPKPKKLTKQNQAKLFKEVNHKSGQSQRKLASKYGVSKTTIFNTLKSGGIKYRKKIRVPKATPAQKEKQRDRIHRLAQGDFAETDPRDILIDDESYFTLTGASLPGNVGFYTSNFEETPENVKFREDVKFEEKVMVWMMIARTGISKIFISPKHQSMNAELYRKKCLSKVLEFVDTHYESRNQVIFWPDLATCHYAKVNQAWMKEQDLYFIPKEDNPPACPQIRPIEQFWSMLKNKVYENNWSAKNREQLIRKIQKCAKEFDMDPIIKMFDTLKAKIKKADQHGLRSLTK